MIVVYGKDKYGRMIADVLVPNGTNVNHTLVKEGRWWWYRKYAGKESLSHPDVPQCLADKVVSNQWNLISFT